MYWIFVSSPQWSLNRPRKTSRHNLPSDQSIRIGKQWSSALAPAFIFQRHPDSTETRRAVLIVISTEQASPGSVPFSAQFWLRDSTLEFRWPARDHWCVSPCSWTPGLHLPFPASSSDSFGPFCVSYFCAPCIKELRHRRRSIFNRSLYRLSSLRSITVNLEIHVLRSWHKHRQRLLNISTGVYTFNLVFTLFKFSTVEFELKCSRFNLVGSFQI